MNKYELKCQALLESLSDTVRRYESVAADHRVQITLLSATIEQLNEEIENLKKEAVVQEKDTTHDSE